MVAIYSADISNESFFNKSTGTLPTHFSYTICVTTSISCTIWSTICGLVGNTRPHAVSYIVRPIRSIYTVSA